MAEEARTTGATGVVGHTSAFRVLKDPRSGREGLRPAKQVRRGDVVEYRLKYRNLGKQPALDYSVIGRIPKRATYVDQSATNTGDVKLVFSIDGGKTYDLPPVPLTGKGAGDGNGKKLATPDMYTHVRWWLIHPLEPNQAIELKYRVTIKQ